MSNTLRAEYEAGSTIKELTDRHGLPYRQARERLLAEDVTLRPPKVPPLPMPNGLDKAYRDGASIRRLAEYHDISYDRVRRHLLKLGVELRPRSQPRGTR